MYVIQVQFDWLLVCVCVCLFQAGAEVVIHIADVNDNFPVFSYPVHVGSIAENSPNNTFVPLVRAAICKAKKGQNEA